MEKQIRRNKKKLNRSLGEPSNAPRKSRMPKKTKITHDYNFKNANLDKMIKMNSIDWRTRMSILEYENLRKDVKALEVWKNDSIESDFF